MQIIGLLVLVFVVWFGFRDRGQVTISVFDAHALVIVLLGSAAAVMVSSRTITAWRTVLCLREFIPGLRRYANDTRAMQDASVTLGDLWREGKRSAAVEHAEKSESPLVKRMLELVLNRAPEAASAKVFLEMRHDEIGLLQPAAHNWEILARLGPAFGMVGTITGMVTLFKNMNSENLNIGASMSLALIATLYGVCFGFGIAGPIAHYLNGLLDDRLAVIERCERSVNEIIAVARQ